IRTDNLLGIIMLGGFHLNDPLHIIGSADVLMGALDIVECAAVGAGLTFQIVIPFSAGFTGNHLSGHTHTPPLILTIQTAVSPIRTDAQDNTDKKAAGRPGPVCRYIATARAMRSRTGSGSAGRKTPD